MAEKEKKPGLMDYGPQVLQMLLGNKTADKSNEGEKKNARVTIESITLDDLEKEQVRLDLEKRKLLRELSQVEADKRKFFEEGVKNTSQRERTAFAREVDSLDMKAQNKDRILRSIDKQKQIIEGLISIKERARILNESGLASVIGNIDLDELIQYVDNSLVDGEFHMAKFDKIIDTLGLPGFLSPEASESSRVSEILKQMEAASMERDNPNAIDEHIQRLNQDFAKRGKENEPYEETL